MEKYHQHRQMCDYPDVPPGVMERYLQAGQLERMREGTDVIKYVHDENEDEHVSNIRLGKVNSLNDSCDPNFDHGHSVASDILFASRRRRDQQDRDQDSVVIDQRRAPSVTKVSGLSLHLQMDQERFVERRRSFDDSEKMKKSQQEEYENYLRQRTLRASLNSKKTFEDLYQRNQEWLQTRQEKQANKQAELELQQEQEIKEFRLKMLQHLNRPIPKYDPLWAELQTESDKNRKQQQRGRSPAVSNRGRSAEPASRSQSQPHSRAQSKGRTDTGKINKPATPVSLTNEEFVQQMEKRQKEQLEKKVQREQRKLQQEQQTKQHQQELEKHRYEKLMTMPLPKGATRATKAAEERDRATKLRLQQQQQQLLQQQQRREAVERNQKHIAAVLKSIIALNDADRKAKHGGYVELTSVVADKMKFSERSFKEALVQNRKKIEEALEKRPTLLQRHHELAVKQTAVKKATDKVISLSQHHQQSLPATPSKLKRNSTASKFSAPPTAPSSSSLSSQQQRWSSGGNVADDVKDNLQRIAERKKKEREERYLKMQDEEEDARVEVVDDDGGAGNGYEDDFETEHINNNNNPSTTATTTATAALNSATSGSAKNVIILGID